jgi:glycerophosphoryl diester phosphodiesterase
MQLIGHAALSYLEPHRTARPEGMARAASLGLELLELDVCVSADGLLLLRHDDSLADGTPVRTVPARHHELAALRTLQLDFVVGGAVNTPPLLLDVKGEGTAVALGAWLAARDAGEFRVCATDWDGLARLQGAAPEARLWPSAATEDQVLGLAAVSRSLRAEGVCVHWAQLSEPVIAEFHEQGLLVAAWTVNEPAVALRLRDSGADLITTDEPELLLGAL